MSAGGHTRFEYPLGKPLEALASKGIDVSFKPHLKKTALRKQLMFLAKQKRGAIP